MKTAFIFILTLITLGSSWPALAQREFRQYPGYEYEADTHLPADWQEPGEFVSARLMYPSYRGWGGNWEQGGTTWGVDYPKGDRTFLSLVERFTTVNTRSVEQPVNLNDGDDVFYWPFLMVGLAGNWQLTDSMVAKLREYLLRGGFLYCDSFFGSGDWAGFMAGINRIFPDRQVIDLSPDHPVFHSVYDIPELTVTQIPNMNSLMGGGGGWLSDGWEPHWRGIVDDNGRLMVLIGFNNDGPDAWQWADDPRYPHEAVNLGLRMAANIVVYTMTH